MYSRLMGIALCLFAILFGWHGLRTDSWMGVVLCVVMLIVSAVMLLNAQDAEASEKVQRAYSKTEEAYRQMRDDYREVMSKAHGAELNAQAASTAVQNLSKAMAADMENVLALVGKVKTQSDESLSIAVEAKEVASRASLAASVR